MREATKVVAVAPCRLGSRNGSARKARATQNKPSRAQANERARDEKDPRPWPDPFSCYLPVQRSRMIRYFDCDQNRSASLIFRLPRNEVRSRAETSASSRLCRETIA